MFSATPSDRPARRFAILATIALAGLCQAYCVVAVFSVNSWWRDRYFPYYGPRDIPTLLDYGTYIALPLALVLLGIISDRYGRRAGLSTSLILGGIPLLIIAFLPGHEALGVAGIIVLFALLLQAAAVNPAIAATYLLEAAPAGRQALWVAWQPVGTSVALRLGILAVALFLPTRTEFLSTVDYSTDASRIPLLIGAIALPFGILLRFLVPESEPFLARQNRPGCWTILSAVLADWRTIGVCVLLAALFPPLMGLMSGQLTSLGRVYGFLNSTSHLVDYTRVAAALFTIVTAWQCERIGRRRILMTVAALSLLTLSPALVFFLAHPSLAFFILLHGWVALLLGAYAGVLLVTLAEQMPIEVRVTGLIFVLGLMSITIGKANVFVFGVLRAPGATIFTEGGSRLLLIGWLTVCSLLCLAAALRIRDRSGAPTQAQARDIAAPPAPDPKVAPAVTDESNWHAALLTSLADTGVEGATPGGRVASRLGWGLLTIVLLSISWVIGRVIIPGAFGRDPQSEFFATILWFAFSVLVLSRPAVASLRRNWRAGARGAEAELQRSGSRRPIFYLRSFDIDQKIGRISIIEILAGRAFHNAEEALANRLRWYGPVIAIGRPGETLPMLGAARFYVSHDRWQGKVADVARASQLVVWVTGTTEGLRWEISHLLETLPPAKLIVWAHPHLLRQLPPDREAEWQQFLATLGSVFPHPLPPYLGITRFFHFDTDFSPVAATSLRSVLAAKGMT
jgi:MFS transporter, MHS family, citrate/tricarballylate:H+ symporter